MCYESQVLNKHPLSKEELLAVMLWPGVYLNSSSSYCQWLQIFDKDRKSLIYLGHWIKKHWKRLVKEKKH